MIEFLKKNWLGLLGLFVGLIGIVLSVIFYSRTLATRDPVFVVDPKRTEIIKADRVSNAPLKVFRAEGGEISGDISSVMVYIWNRGNISIKPEHILQPLRLIIDDPKGEILDFKILKKSRDIVEPEVKRFPEDPKHILSVDFKILEQDDGFCIQIIFVGNHSTDFKIDGQVEGVPNPIGSSKIEKSRFWSLYFNKVKSFVTILIPFFAVLFAWVVVEHFFDSLKKKANRWLKSFEVYIKWGQIIISILIIIWIIIFILIVKPIKEAKEEARLSIVESVPSSIVPQTVSKETLKN